MSFEAFKNPCTNTVQVYFSSFEPLGLKSPPYGGLKFILLKMRNVCFITNLALKRSQIETDSLCIITMTTDELGVSTLMTLADFACKMGFNEFLRF